MKRTSQAVRLKCCARVRAGRDIRNWFGGAVKALAVGLAVALAGVAQATVENKNGVDWTYSDDGMGNATIESIPKDTEGEVNIPPKLGPGDCYTVAHIAADAFKDCTLIKRTHIPSSVESVGASAFEGCTALESAELTGSMTTLPDRMFKGCAALKSVGLMSYSLVTIGANAFGGCIALESIVLPEDELTTIGSGAFNGCSALKEVTMKSKKMASIAANAFSGSGLKTVYVAEGQTATVTAAGLDPSAGGFTIKEISDVKTWEDTTTTIIWSYRKSAKMRKSTMAVRVVPPSTSVTSVPSRFHPRSMGTQRLLSAKVRSMDATTLRA